MLAANQFDQTVIRDAGARLIENEAGFIAHRLGDVGEHVLAGFTLHDGERNAGNDVVGMRDAQLAKRLGQLHGVGLDHLHSPVI